MTIFADRSAAIEQLSEDYLSLVSGSHFKHGKPHDAALLRFLLASEQEAARRLGVSLEPVKVYPMVDPTPAELEQLNGRPFIVEPGYDLDDGFFSMGAWGSIKLRQRPVISIESVRLVYPGINAQIYAVPPEWVLLDRKPGIVQFMPAPTGSGMPASILSFNAISAGRAVPQLIRVNYTAGLTEKHPCFLDVRDVIMRMTVLRIVRATLPAQSSSLSADGLSRSTSFDPSAHNDMINADLADLRQRISGIMFGVL